MICGLGLPNSSVARLRDLNFIVVNNPGRACEGHRDHTLNARFGLDMPLLAWSGTTAVWGTGVLPCFYPLSSEPSIEERRLSATGLLGIREIHHALTRTLDIRGYVEFLGRPTDRAVTLLIGVHKHISPLKCIKNVPCCNSRVARPFAVRVGGD